MKKKTKSKRKPVDATMRNVRAANKRIDALEVRFNAWIRLFKAILEQV